MADSIQCMTLVVRVLALGVSIVAVYVVYKQLQVVYQQLQKVNETILGNAFSSCFIELRELHKVFIEDPKLRPYFYEDEHPTPKSDAYQKAMAVAEMFFDAFIHMYLLRSRFPEDLREHIDLYIEDMINLSEFLSDYLAKNEKWMPADLRSLVKRLVAKRKSGGQVSNAEP